MEEVLAMRAKYEALGKVEGLTSEQMFGKKDAVNYMDVLEVWEISLRTYEPTGIFCISRTYS